VFCERHDIDVSDARKRMRLEFSEDNFRLNRLREAQRIWRDAGQDLARLRVADVIVNGTRKGKLMHLVGIPD
jgi:hypothetical protein